MSPEISPGTCLAVACVRFVNDGEIHDFFFSTTESKLKQQSKARVFLMFLLFSANKELVLKELC